MRKTLILFVPLIIFAHTLSAQTTITIQKADKLIGKNTREGFLRILKGNVHLKTKDQDLFCDSAYQYVDKKIVEAFGRVLALDGDQRIQSDSLIYNLNTEIAEFKGHVYIENDSSFVQSSVTRYFYPTKTALFPKRVYLSDKDGIIVADKAMYFTQIDSVIMWENVNVSSDESFVRADSMRANRSTELSEAYGNFEGITKTEFVKSDYSYSDSTGYRRFFGSAFMQRIDSTKSDTLQIGAEEIQVWTLTDSTADFKAKKDVSVWSPDYQTTSQKLVFYDSLSTFFLDEEPKLWYDDLQITSEKTRFVLEDKSPKFLFANNELSIVQLDTVLNRFNQINGDSMRLDFVEDEPEFMYVFGKSDILFHSANDANEPDGALSMVSNGLVITFDSSAISQVKGLDNIQGTYLDENPTLASKRLPRFSWNPELRPKKADKTPDWPDLTVFDPKYYDYWKKK